MAAMAVPAPAPAFKVEYGRLQFGNLTIPLQHATSFRASNSSYRHNISLVFQKDRYCTSLYLFFPTLEEKAAAVDTLFRETQLKAHVFLVTEKGIKIDEPKEGVPAKIYLRFTGDDGDDFNRYASRICNEAGFLVASTAKEASLTEIVPSSIQDQIRKINALFQSLIQRMGDRGIKHALAMLMDGRFPGEFNPPLRIEKSTLEGILDSLTHRRSLSTDGFVASEDLRLRQLSLASTEVFCDPDEVSRWLENPQAEQQIKTIVGHLTNLLRQEPPNLEIVEHVILTEWVGHETFRPLIEAYKQALGELIRSVRAGENNELFLILINEAARMKMDVAALQ